MKTVAHRGETGPHEDTIKGFANAASSGADVIETDLWQTSDGHLIIIHDGTWDRTTDHKGRVGKTSLSTVRTIRTKDGEAIPTLDQAVTESKRTHTPMLVEIKAVVDWQRIGAVIKRHEAQKLITLYSGTPAIIAKFHKAVPWATTGIRMESPMSPSEVAKYGSVVTISPKAATESSIRQFHAKGISVIVRSPKPEQWSQLVAEKADGVLLDDTKAYDNWCAKQ